MNSEADAERNIAGLIDLALRKTAGGFSKLKGGRNSRVFRVECTDGVKFAAKAYFQSLQDTRDRLGNEYRALQFMRAEGMSRVATPMAKDDNLRIAVYEFIEGTSISGKDVSAVEIDQAVEFLGALKHFAGRADASHFSPASEACFSISAIRANLDKRYARLTAACENEPALGDFLQGECLPFLDEAWQWSGAFCTGHAIDLEAETPLSARTLSPSDFGFHNALQRPDGTLAFLDFEYFGWDDPAKTIADFLLHPGMEIAPGLKQRFFSGMISAFPGSPELEQRVCAVYPLFGLKWCAILLNEFALEHEARRCFSDSSPDAWSREVQLQKSKRMLDQVKNNFRTFPHNV